MKVTEAPEGFQVELHQSFLQQYLTCPERARQDYLGLSQRSETDSTAVGTAVHAAIEAYLGGDGVPMAEALGCEMFNFLASDATFKWVKCKTRETAHRDIKVCFQNWLRDVYPQLGSPLSVEEHFRLPFITLDHPLGNVSVSLEGTIDYLDETTVWDWKTSANEQSYAIDYNRGGKGREKQRWAIQPTVYSWAAHQLGYLPEPVDFTWAAMLRGPNGGVQVLRCQRGGADWRRLEALVRNVVKLHFLDLDEWPMNNTSYLCDHKYCDAWASCPMGEPADVGPRSVASVRAL